MRVNPFVTNRRSGAVKQTLPLTVSVSIQLWRSAGEEATEAAVWLQTIRWEFPALKARWSLCPVGVAVREFRCGVQLSSDVFCFFFFFLFYSHFWFTASCRPDWTTVLTAEFYWRQTYSAVLGLLCDSVWQDVFVFVFAGRFLCKISIATLFQSSGMKVPLVNGSTKGPKTKRSDTVRAAQQGNKDKSIDMLNIYMLIRKQTLFSLC